MVSRAVRKHLALKLPWLAALQHVSRSNVGSRARRHGREGGCLCKKLVRDRAHHVHRLLLGLDDVARLRIGRETLEDLLADCQGTRTVSTLHIADPNKP
jgi:hypothetical protein